MKLPATWALALLLCLPASAHLMPERNGTLNVQGNSVFSVISFPLTLYPFLDDNADQGVNESEIGHHQETLKTAIEADMALYQDGEQGRLNLANAVSTEPGSGYVTVLLRHDFTLPPTHFRLHSQWRDFTFSLAATNNNQRDVAIVSPQQPDYTFFRTPTTVFSHYLWLSIERLLSGADHLLFLLTLLLSLTGWRHWVIALTTFTLAHSLSLSLALLNLLPSAFAIITPAVEPAIAASIALMAFTALRYPHPPLISHLALVFAFGLIHGLGFASAITTVGLNSTNLLASLGGFNLGIEIGQIGLALLWWKASQWLPPPGRKAILITTLVVGAAWFLLRLL